MNSQSRQSPQPPQIPICESISRETGPIRSIEPSVVEYQRSTRSYLESSAFDWLQGSIFHAGFEQTLLSLASVPSPPKSAT
ncbi:hypothetical protein PRUPE_1G123600 [Prunus persica]|uniref:Uncharacterized protein n=1 Tax=Prunus persica TaxID=3760 RepID=A0A251QXB8_PRUPE|nr:hypothetical protein PRUPE_1G123600 [Prunus persica]